jgi:hypothetical protein
LILILVRSSELRPALHFIRQKNLRAEAEGNTLRVRSPDDAYRIATLLADRGIRPRILLQR